jgi:hypothetical protein
MTIHHHSKECRPIKETENGATCEQKRMEAKKKEGRKKIGNRKAKKDKRAREGCEL